MPEAGDVVLARVQFADSFEVKKRPAVVLFGEFTNIVVAGITSNTKMRGISLARADGAAKDSVIKANYIFTITEKAISKKLFRLSAEKRAELRRVLSGKLEGLTS